MIVKIEDPKTGQKHDGARKIYKLRMKAGTTGTLEDPHRPEIADFLEGKPHKWSFDEREGTVQVDCRDSDHAEILKTHVLHG